MDEDQSAPTTTGQKIGSDHRLAGSWGRDEYPEVVFS